MIHEKNLKQRISWQCPFKGIIPPELDQLESGATG